ncbi:hypothetical protein [Puniceibacterium sediminis]|uniref:Uncharacterized protein n=1 Tax=Puniceibacterium sediminis TaxID=1608407 RepID=A0A238XX69_9RHOB|nr:hypothetical protein [Puniceibacterium sediminis]SNR63101.1 hypothetical protein SAMN06265370_11372 [Puniceibacterium sediminis]
MRPILTLVLILATQPAWAAVCDYRPSIIAGKAGAAARGGTGALVGAAGAGVRAAGAYTLQHPQTGLSMIGSAVSTATAASASMASGAGGALGTAAAIATAPVTILIAGATAVAMGGYEGACYLGDERITDIVQITAILQNLSDNSDPALFALIPWGASYTDGDGENVTADQARIRVGSAAGDAAFYNLADLYIVNSMLMNRDRGRDTAIGTVGLQVVDVE